MGLKEKNKDSRKENISLLATQGRQEDVKTAEVPSSYYLVCFLKNKFVYVFVPVCICVHTESMKDRTKF